MQEYTVQINNKELPVFVIEKRKKHSSARLKSDGLYIYLSAYQWDKKRAISHFITWAECRAGDKKIKVSLADQLFEGSEFVSPYGETYCVEIHVDSTRKHMKAMLKENVISVMVPKEYPHSERRYRECICRLVLGVLAHRYDPFVTSEVEALYEKYFPGILFNSVSTRFMHSRWGSYSREGNVKLSTLLFMLPREYLTYVIVHELAHGVHMNHSAAFWNEVKKVMPDYKHIEKELKKYQL